MHWLLYFVAEINQIFLISSIVVVYQFSTNTFSLASFAECSIGEYVCVSTVWANNIVYILRHLLFLTNFILNDSTGSLNFAFCSLYSTTGWRVDSEMFKRHLRENYYFFLLKFRISCFFSYASLYHLRFWCLTFLNSRNIYTQQEQKAQVSIISFQVWDFGGLSHRKE